VHYYVGGEAFQQPTPKQPTELTQKQREEIATFGRVSTREQEDYSGAHGFLLEDWQVLDENAQGLRVLRAAGSAGGRYAHGQLVAVRPKGAKHFMLAQVRWLMGGENGDLHAGLRVLPGLPTAVAVRGTGLNTERDEYVQAVFLSAVQALSAPPTLVLPSGWFKPKRVIEVTGERSAKVQLNEAIERGTDFERVAYETAA
jgi:cyclic-di-GMP-binding protein